MKKIKKENMTKYGTNNIENKDGKLTIEKYHRSLYYYSIGIIFYVTVHV